MTAGREITPQDAASTRRLKDWWIHSSGIPWGTRCSPSTASASTRKVAKVMPDVETSVLYCNDNLERLAALPDECVDLIYLDPPFFSNRTYEVIWGDEAEVRSFQDRWDGGIQHYIDWMRKRVEQMHRVLKPSGSIFLHCDWHASHHLRVMLDEVFGQRQFLNELIWFYKGGGASTKRWSRKHDAIFWYAKSKSWTFNLDEVRTSYSDEILSRPKSSYRHHHYGTKATTHAVTDGWDLNPLGKRPDDVIEMPIINPAAKERMGYPTQKPEALLEVLLLGATNRGDIVLDPFAGCGTSVAVAERLGRRWIGIDISPTAMGVMRRRFWNLTRSFPRVVDMPDTEQALYDLGPFEFQNQIITALNGTHNPKKVKDMGIDGFWFLTKDPIQVKQSRHVGRPVVDEFQTAIRRVKHDTGYIVAFSFTKDAHEEVARAKKDGLFIKLILVKEILLLMRRPEDALRLASRHGPQPGSDQLEGTVIDLPIHQRTDLPSAAELVASGGTVPAA